MKDDRVRRRLSPCVGLLIPLALSGCNFVPRSRVEEGRQIAQTLRSENVRLKDQNLALRAKNQDLIQRAQDDAHRLATQDEAVQRLEQSVTAYQAERDQLAKSFETFKRQAQQAATSKGATADWNGPPQPVGDPIELFVANHPDWVFDSANKTLSISAERLFDHGSNALNPEGQTEIRAVGEALAAASKESEDPMPIEVEAPGEPGDVRQAVFQDDPGSSTETDVSRRFSAASRGARVRESLLGSTGLDPSLARIAPPDAAPPGPSKGNSRLVLRLVPVDRTKPPASAALDSATKRD